MKKIKINKKILLATLGGAIFISGYLGVPKLLAQANEGEPVNDSGLIAGTDEHANSLLEQEASRSEYMTEYFMYTVEQKKLIDEHVNETIGAVVVRLIDVANESKIVYEGLLFGEGGKKETLILDDLIDGFYPSADRVDNLGITYVANKVMLRTVRVESESISTEVKHVFKDSMREIAPPTKIEGKVGESYVPTPLEIKGYKQIPYTQEEMDNMYFYPGQTAFVYYEYSDIASDLIDSTELQNLIAEYNQYDKTKYTETSWDQFKKIVTLGEEFLISVSKNEVEPDIIISRYQNTLATVKTAPGYLIDKEDTNVIIEQPKPDDVIITTPSEETETPNNPEIVINVNLDELSQKISELRAIDVSSYTKPSVDAMIEKLLIAERIVTNITMNGSGDYTQELIDEQVIELENAKLALIPGEYETTNPGTTENPNENEQGEAVGTGDEEVNKGLSTGTKVFMVTSALLGTGWIIIKKTKKEEE